MASIINTNIQSLNAQRSLAASQNSLATSMQRLSSGMRINSAKDDAAGLAIAERMTTQIRGLNQAQRNANDGISLAQTAEGALSTIGNNLQRIRELAVQSRNATNSTEDRAALQKEVDQLKSEIDRVATDTSFNSTNLLDGSFTAKAFQVGANQGQLISIDSIQNARIDQLGTWKSVDKPAAAYGAALTSQGTPDKTGKLSVTVPANATEASAAFADFKVVIGGAEINVAGLKAGTRTPAETQAELSKNIASAINGAGVPGVTAEAGATDVTLTNATIKVPTLQVSGAGNVTATAMLASTTGTLTQLTGFSINGKPIDVGAAYSGADRVNDLVTEINKQFSDKSVVASNVNGSLVLKSDKDIVVAGGAAGTTGLTAATFKQVKGEEQIGFKNISVGSAESADDTIVAMDAALKAVNSSRADLGAIQNRFEAVVSNLSIGAENLSASRSRIMDADFAAETANLSRTQILQQAGTAMVAQANQLPQQVLKLLQG
ncbi:flagellin [Comamonas sp.]|uniref:flagellin N-terminal helical domain-containing protein n=1 Tax=Comamonas sp. TaxID=34028 RepID=UPI003A8F0EE1